MGWQARLLPSSPHTYSIHRQNWLPTNSKVVVSSHLWSKVLCFQDEFYNRFTADADETDWGVWVFESWSVSRGAQLTTCHFKPRQKHSSSLWLTSRRGKCVFTQRDLRTLSNLFFHVLLKFLCMKMKILFDWKKWILSVCVRLWTLSLFVEQEWAYVLWFPYQFSPLCIRFSCIARCVTLKWSIVLCVGLDKCDAH